MDDKDYILQSLRDIGYDEIQANHLYNLYERQCDIDGLLSYIISKECMKTML